MSPYYLLKFRTHSYHRKYIVFLQTVVAVKRRAVLCGTGRYEKSRLCSVAAWISDKQRHFKYSMWLHPHGYTLPVFSPAIASSATLCWNSAHVSINKPLTQLVHASCPICRNQPGLGYDCWLATCQDWHGSLICWKTSTSLTMLLDRWQQLLHQQHISIVLSKWQELNSYD